MQEAGLLLPGGICYSGERFGAQEERYVLGDFILGKSIILEIELPEDDLTCRRKGFYESNGFRENPWHHIQPKYRPLDKDLQLLLSCPEDIDRKTWQRLEAFLEENVAERPK